MVVLRTSGHAQSAPTIGSELHPSIAAARELYETADYANAVEMLERLAAGNPSSSERQSIDLYRTFCLVALGRANDASQTIAAMLTRDPLYRPEQDTHAWWDLRIRRLRPPTRPFRR